MKYLVLALLLSSSLMAQSQVPDSVLHYANQKVQEFSENYPGVSVSISLNGSIAWNKAIGYSDIVKKELVTSNTKFNIYSTSKLITGLAYMKLLHSGTIPNLEIKVIELDPTLPASYSEITLGQLLMHRSGIRHYNGKSDWTTFAAKRCAKPEDALNYFKNDKLIAQPGTEEIYSTYGLVLASHLLEKITGQPYIEAINDLVPFSQPLELDSENADKATPYLKKGNKFEVLSELCAQCKFGGGGLLASSDQLVEAGQLLYDGTNIPFNEVRAFITSQYTADELRGTSFAMGSGLTELDGKEILYINMGGGSPGGRSYLLVLSDLKVAVSITSNCEGSGDDAYQLAIDLAKKFAGI